ncbi:hypothetical protein WA158_006694 [Blastocystis sp. Blastoise]
MSIKVDSRKEQKVFSQRITVVCDDTSSKEYVLNMFYNLYDQQNGEYIHFELIDSENKLILLCSQLDTESYSLFKEKQHIDCDLDAFPNLFINLIQSVTTMSPISIPNSIFSVIKFAMSLVENKDSSYTFCINQISQFQILPLLTLSFTVPTIEQYRAFMDYLIKQKDSVITEYYNQIDILKKKINELSEKYSNLNIMINEQKESITKEKDKQIKEIKDELFELKEKSEKDIQSASDAFSKQLNEKMDEINQLKTTIDEKEKKINDLEDSIANDVNGIKSYRTEKQTYIDQINDLKKQIESQKDIETQLKGQITQLNNQITDINSKMSTSEQNLNSTTQQFTNLTSAYNSLQNEINQCKQQINELETDKSSIESQYNSCQRENSQLKLSIDNYKSQVKTLKDKDLGNEQIISYLNNELNQLQLQLHSFH